MYSGYGMWSGRRLSRERSLWLLNPQASSKRKSLSREHSTLHHDSSVEGNEGKPVKKKLIIY